MKKLHWAFGRSRVAALLFVIVLILGLGGGYVVVKNMNKSDQNNSDPALTEEQILRNTPPQEFKYEYDTNNKPAVTGE